VRLDYFYAYLMNVLRILNLSKNLLSSINVIMVVGPLYAVYLDRTDSASLRIV